MTRRPAATTHTQPDAPSASNFAVPRDGEVFEADVLERCQNLITSGIWEGIPQHRMKAWLTNFSTAPERYFAACVLDALIYRSENQTVAMMRQIFERTLPDLLRTDPSQHPSTHDWGEALHRDTPTDPGLRLIPVIRSEDSPAKSGPLICRMYRRHLQFNDRWMIWPWQLPDARSRGTSVFVFVDDFLGTGDQFSSFVECHSLAGSFEDIYAVYAPLVAHTKGIQFLLSRYPKLRVIASEVLDDAHHLFSDSAICFRDDLNSPSAAHAFYMQISREHGLRSTTGYGDLALAYAFEHATPDNCLPMLWQATPKWKPLFER